MNKKLAEAFADTTPGIRDMFPRLIAAGFIETDADGTSVRLTADGAEAYRGLASLMALSDPMGFMSGVMVLAGEIMKEMGF